MFACIFNSRKMLGRLFLAVVLAAFSAVHVNCIDNLLVLSIATEETDGFVRYERSLKAYNYPYQVTDTKVL